MPNKRFRLNIEEQDLIMTFRNRNNEERVLVIGDLHAPFIKEGYLEHCRAVYRKYKCNRVIFIGDILDNHYTSFHPTDPDGYGAGDELERAVREIQKWYKAFPNAEVVIGNHDRLAIRKAFASGVSKFWIKDYSEVLGTPNWKFDVSFEHNGVLYIHGEGGGGINGALVKALNKRLSIVQGHFHTESHIRWNASDTDLLFAMQVGCGVDDKAYAMEYAKLNTKKSIIACGVVLDNGTLPILEPMKIN